MTNQPSLRDRKKAQPKAVVLFSDAEKSTIRQTIAKTLDDTQFKIFLYTAQALGLNPLLNEIACITFKDRDGGRTMSIQVMRDGFLTIAHRSGKFAGLESGVKFEDRAGKTEMIGWAKVYHKDYAVPVYQEADLVEYESARNQLWSTKPRTMIKKVAESMALRKAFNINGVYAPEEMEKEIQVVKPLLEVKNGSDPATPEQLATLESLGIKGKETGELTKQEASQMIGDLSKAK